MLVPELKDSVGELLIMRTQEGYQVQATGETMIHPASLELLFPFLRREVLIFFIRARRDLFWMHAGAVERHGNAVLVAGSSGRGKSSIVTRLCERQWKLLSDENAPIDMRTNEVLPFPQMPRRRLPIGREVELAQFGALDFEEINVAQDQVRYAPAPISAMIFPLFRHGSSPRLERLTPGAAALEIVQNATNFADHKAAGVEQAANMARSISSYRVTYDDPAEAVSLIESL
jgi:serine kinase of HPr protein (carbohydrate metabolism regulator)